MQTIIIALLTAFITLLLSHLFEVYRKENAQKREIFILFYAKIKKAEAEIFDFILRGNYGWGNSDEYRDRIGKASKVYETLLNEFYEQLLFEEGVREKTKQVIFSFWNNIISKIIRSQDDMSMRIAAMNFYDNDLQKNRECKEFCVND